jgi:protein-S-isoprenylcysteine O-methyltransferase Ste14
VSEGAIEAFRLFYGEPSKSAVVFAVMAFVLIAIVLIVLTIKAFKDRANKNNFDESDVVSVMLRGLLVLLLFTAIFSL